jgi:hypothetical protein
MRGWLADWFAGRLARAQMKAGLANWFAGRLDRFQMGGGGYRLAFL